MRKGLDLRKSLATLALSLAGSFIGYHLASLTAVSAANHNPYLSGGGAAIPNAVVFPENATPANISASGGNLILKPRVGIAINPSVLFHASTNGLVPSSTLFGAGDAGIFTGTGIGSIVRLIGVPNSPGLVFQGAGGTIAAPTTSVNGNTLGTLFWIGHDGTTRQLAAQIISFVDAAVGAGIVPGRISFQTATAGGVMTEALKLDSAQLATFSGNVNTTAGVYQKGGVSGTGTNALFTVCQGVAAGPPATCLSPCTLQFSGGIRLGGTCP